MNWDQVQGKWTQMKGSVREKWGRLTDDDFEVIAGNRDQFIGKIQERYGYAREEALKRTDEWLKSLGEVAREHQAAKIHSGEKTFTSKP